MEATERWYRLSGTEVLERLHSREEGLRSAEARKRAVQHGLNELPEAPQPTLLARFLKQFASPLISLLLLAVVVLFYRGEQADATIVLSVLVLNAVIGVVQEGRAKRALAALRSYSVANATVRRDGLVQVIPERDLVPGDVIELREGERVPADARIIHTHEIQVDESVLTGESLPVSKRAEPLQTDEPLAPHAQRNMVFSGTFVSHGSALAVVVSTGVETELGKIAGSLKEVDTPIPLEREVRLLGRQLIIGVSILATLLIVLGVLRGDEPSSMVALALALAISIIPEGLPVVMTYVLAKGVTRMAKRNVLMKQLPAVESLGSVDVVAVDKTGTITRNELAVTRVWTLDELYEVEVHGYEATGEVRAGSGRAVHLEQLATTALLTNSAVLTPHEGGWKVQGEPTEAALGVLAEKLEPERAWNLVKDPGFDYRKKLHAVLHQESGYRISVAGAPEAVLERCGLFALELDRALTAVHAFSHQGLRVIALAHHVSRALPDVEELPKLQFDGLVAMQDGLKDGVQSAVQRLHRAGIRVAMITGDVAATAQSLAAEAGIFRPGDKVLSGADVARMSLEELSQAVQDVTVFARIVPEDKLKIIEAYQLAGLTTAMTGDGVNDAPALVAADIGIAMGLGGTEVAKEAADVVLLDDNLGSIAAGVEEGRGISANLRKVVGYLVAGSISQVVLTVAALLGSLPLPLSPSQIIWLNLITDGVLVLAVASEPLERRLMTLRYKNVKTLVTTRSAATMLYIGMAMGVSVGVVYLLFLRFEPGLAQTVSLTAFAAAHFGYAWSARSSYRTLKQLGTKNHFLIKAMVGMGAVQLLAVYWPPLSAMLHTQALPLPYLALVILPAAAVLLADELRKQAVKQLRW